VFGTVGVPYRIAKEVVCFVDTRGHFRKFANSKIGKLEIRIVSRDRANDVLLLHLTLNGFLVFWNIRAPNSRMVKLGTFPVC